MYRSYFSILPAATNRSVDVRGEFIVSRRAPRKVCLIKPPPVVYIRLCLFNFLFFSFFFLGKIYRWRIRYCGPEHPSGGALYRKQSVLRRAHTYGKPPPSRNVWCVHLRGILFICLREENKYCADKRTNKTRVPSSNFPSKYRTSKISREKTSLGRLTVSRGISRNRGDAASPADIG